MIKKIKVNKINTCISIKIMGNFIQVLFVAILKMNQDHFFNNNRITKLSKSLNKLIILVWLIKFKNMMQFYYNNLK